MADDDLDEDDELEEGEEGEEGEDGEESSGGGKKKLFIIIGLVVLLLVGGGAAAFFLGFLDPILGGSDEEASAEGEDGEGGEGGAPAGASVFYDLPEMLVNLNTGDRKSTFLKIKVALELPSAEEIPKVQAIMPRIIDNFQVYLRELRIDDLKGSAGMYRLREELLTRVNAAAQPAKINAVLFKEMLIQ